MTICTTIGRLEKHEARHSGKENWKSSPGLPRVSLTPALNKQNQRSQKLVSEAFFHFSVLLSHRELEGVSLRFLITKGTCLLICYTMRPVWQLIAYTYKVKRSSVFILKYWPCLYHYDIRNSLFTYFQYFVSNYQRQKTWQFKFSIFFNSIYFTFHQFLRCINLSICFVKKWEDVG